jgi:hypothetical protein
MNPRARASRRRARERDDPSGIGAREDTLGSAARARVADRLVVVDDDEDDAPMDDRRRVARARAAHVVARAALIVIARGR